MEIKDLESKIWFRFLKVVFVFAYILTLVVVLVFAYDSKPYTIIDNYNSVIVCDNGTRYKAGDNNINAEGARTVESIPSFQLKAKSVDTGLSNYEFSLYEAKIQATHLCQSYSGEKVGFIPDVSPYKVELVKKTVGDWWVFIGYMILSLFIVVIMFELIRRSFFYVAIGKKFLK